MSVFPPVIVEIEGESIRMMRSKKSALLPVPGAAVAAFGTPSGYDDALWARVRQYSICNFGTAKHGATGTFSVAWDCDNLYVRAESNGTSRQCSAKNSWDNDGIEIFINEDGSRPEGYGSTDYQLLVSACGTVTPGGAGVSAIRAPKASAETKHLSPGFGIFVRIPWCTTRSKEDGFFAFNIMVSDAQNMPTRQSAALWHGNSMSGHATLLEIGLVKLSVLPDMSAVPMLPSESVALQTLNEQGLIFARSTFFAPPSARYYSARTVFSMRDENTADTRRAEGFPNARKLAASCGGDVFCRGGYTVHEKTLVTDRNELTFRCIVTATIDNEESLWMLRFSFNKELFRRNRYHINELSLHRYRKYPYGTDLTVGEAKRRARNWLLEQLPTMAGYYGSLVAGSVNWMRDNDPWNDVSDIDIFLFRNGLGADVFRQKIRHQDVLLEPSNQMLHWHGDDPYRILEDVFAAPHFAHGLIFDDPVGRIEKIRKVVAAEYAMPKWIQRRMTSVFMNASWKLTHVYRHDGDITPGLLDTLTSGIKTIGTVIAVSQCLNPSYRRSLMIAKDVLHAAGNASLYASIMGIIASASAEPQMVSAEINAQYSALDRAVAVLKTPFFHDVEIRPQAMIMLKNGAHDMAINGYPEAARWFILTLRSFAQQALENDTVGEERDHWRNDFRQFLSGFALGSMDAVRTCAKEGLVLLHETYHFCRSIMNKFS